MNKLPVALLLHDDESYLAEALRPYSGYPAFAFISRTPWHGEVGDWEVAVEVARQAGVEVVLDDWHNGAEYCTLWMKAEE